MNNFLSNSKIIAKYNSKFPKKYQILQTLIVFQLVAPDGKPIVAMPNPDIPDDVIIQLNHLRTVDGMSLEDAITNIRGNLVPQGYSPCPFRRDTPESLLDKLRSLVTTYKFRAIVSYWKERGADFSA